MNQRSNSLAVVVPVYGSLPHIEACLQSIECQSVQWDEKIAVIDCVEDHRVVDLLASRSDWKVVENPEPKGITGSTQAAIDLCSTEFVALVDCDDVVHGRTVEIIKTIVDDASVDAVGLISFAYRSSSSTDSEWKEWSQRAVEIDRISRRKSLVHCYGTVNQLLLDHNVASHLKVFRRSCVVAVPVDYEGVQDAVAVNEVASRSGVLLRPEILYMYRLHAGQTSMIQRVNQIRKINHYRTSVLNRGLQSPRRMSTVDKLVERFRINLIDVDIPIFTVFKEGEVSYAGLLSHDVWKKSLSILHDADAVVITCEEWFDLGALPGIADRRMESVIVLDQTKFSFTDLAKWYGGYFDAVLCRSKIDVSILRQFLPGQALICLEEVDLDWNSAWVG
jgi:glycosyltransferase involved in cell wall biosynthesis